MIRRSRKNDFQRLGDRVVSRAPLGSPQCSRCGHCGVTRRGDLARPRIATTRTGAASTARRARPARGTRLGSASRRTWRGRRAACGSTCAEGRATLGTSSSTSRLSVPRICRLMHGDDRRVVGRPVMLSVSAKARNSNRRSMPPDRAARRLSGRTAAAGLALGQRPARARCGRRHGGLEPDDSGDCRRHVGGTGRRAVRGHFGPFSAAHPWSCRIRWAGCSAVPGSSIRRAARSSEARTANARRDEYGGFVGGLPSRPATSRARQVIQGVGVLRMTLRCSAHAAPDWRRSRRAAQRAARLASGAMSAIPAGAGDRRPEQACNGTSQSGPEWPTIAGGAGGRPRGTAYCMTSVRATFDDRPGSR